MLDAIHVLTMMSRSCK